MQNQLKARLICRNIGWVITLHAFFLLCTCYEMNGFEMTLLAYRTSESGAISIIFEQAIHRSVIELGRSNVTF